MSTVGGSIELRLTSDVSQKKTLDKLRIASHGKYIPTIRFSPDGKLLATGGSDGTIDLWDVSELASAAERFENQDRETAGNDDSKTSFIRTVSEPQLIRTIKAYTNPVAVLDSALNFSDRWTAACFFVLAETGSRKTLEAAQGTWQIRNGTRDR